MSVSQIIYVYKSYIYIYIYKFESLDKPGIGDGYNHPSQLFAREEFHTFPGNVCLLVLAENVLAIDDNSFEGKRRPTYVPSSNSRSMRWERACAVKCEYRTALHIDISEFPERRSIDSIRTYVLKIHLVLTACERRNPPTQV